ncbi:MAG: J domain-containing protein, partial [Candidatus Eiseniibacteriota bacterium]
MTDTAQRYPLAWPAGWRRTPALQRQRAQFGTVQRQRMPDGVSRYAGKRRLSVGDATARLAAELHRLGARDELLSTNLRLRLDGLPRSDTGEPVDPGAAVYFRLKGAPRCLACDRWARVADNVAALAHHIEALRAIERYGVGTTEQAFAGYAALAPSTDEWWLVLGVARAATLDDVEEA